jgi:hypothetical protein
VIHVISNYFGHTDSSFTIVIRAGRLRNRDLIPGTGNFLLHYGDQADSGARPVSYSVGNRETFCEGKTAGA